MIEKFEYQMAERSRDLREIKNEILLGKEVPLQKQAPIIAGRALTAQVKHLF